MQSGLVLSLSLPFFRMCGVLKQSAVPHQKTDVKGVFFSMLGCFIRLGN